MRLLIITQKVDKNDSILGFFHRWLVEFSKHCEKLIVICLYKGEHNLSKSVEILSLGKEDYQLSTINYQLQKLRYIINFYKHIWSERNNYDAVFVHMNPIYIVFGGIFWKLSGKRIALWYTHRKVDLKLRIAEKLSNVIFTVAKESFCIKSDKVRVVGHGIPVENFKRPITASSFKVGSNDRLGIVSVGRVTPIKNLDTLIETAGLLKKEGVNFIVRIVGGPTEFGDDKYLEKLRKMVVDLDLRDEIVFVGSVTNDEVKKYYWESDISVNLCPTGGVDKAVLESMSAGLPVFASNIAFTEYFGEVKDDLIFKEKDPQDLSKKIIKLIKNKDLAKVGGYLLNRVTISSSLPSLINKIILELKQ